MAISINIAKKDYHRCKQLSKKRLLSQINQMASKYKLLCSIFSSKFSLVYKRIINAFTGARYGATNRIYIAAPTFHHARSSRSLRFIVLFWQLLAVNSQLINNRTGNIIAVPRAAADSYEASMHR